jgi:hypothetical protein
MSRRSRHAWLRSSHLADPGAALMGRKLVSDGQGSSSRRPEAPAGVPAGDPFQQEQKIRADLTPCPGSPGAVADDGSGRRLGRRPGIAAALPSVAAPRVTPGGGGRGGAPDWARGGGMRPAGACEPAEGSAETVALSNAAFLLLRLLTAHFGTSHADTLTRALVALAEKAGIGSLVERVSDRREEIAAENAHRHGNSRKKSFHEELLKHPSPSAANGWPGAKRGMLS